MYELDRISEVEDMAHDMDRSIIYDMRDMRVQQGLGIG